MIHDHGLQPAMRLTDLFALVNLPQKTRAEWLHDDSLTIVVPRTQDRYTPTGQFLRRWLRSTVTFATEDLVGEAPPSPAPPVVPPVAAPLVTAASSTSLAPAVTVAPRRGPKPRGLIWSPDDVPPSPPRPEAPPRPGRKRKEAR
jgi:hypothetical protein